MADGVSHSLKGFDQYDVLLGDELRGERATKGKSLLDVQRDLKIKASYIAAIENCDLEVFSNRGFIAGYVKSYARYLGLSPESVYERFCNEAGFSNANNVFNLEIKKSDLPVKKNFGPDSTWEPSKIGQIDYKGLTISDLIARSAPIVLVVFVLLGSSWGAISVLKQVQKLDIVAFEELPQVFTEPVNVTSTSTLLDLGIDVYSSSDLMVPVFEPRDRALSTLKPNRLTALENKTNLPAVTYSTISTSNQLLKEGKVQSLSYNDTSNFGLPDPVVRSLPYVPGVKILAITPAWIRVKNENGDVVFEETLKQQESYSVNKELFGGELRAGNAQNVFFVIDEKVFGPLSRNKSVVKNISLNPKLIKLNFSLSAAATESYANKNFDQIIIDTAGVTE